MFTLSVEPDIVSSASGDLQHLGSALGDANAAAAGLIATRRSFGSFGFSNRAGTSHICADISLLFVSRSHGSLRLSRIPAAACVHR
jgi:hypothetical protein